MTVFSRISLVLSRVPLIIFCGLSFHISTQVALDIDQKLIESLPTEQFDPDFNMEDVDFGALSQALEEELSKLSPEEREEFDSLVNQFTKMLEEMPEEEFEQMLSDLEQELQGQGFEIPEAETGAELEVKIPEPVASAAIPEEVARLVQQVQAIKTYLSLFLVKINSAPEFYLKVTKWIAQGKVSAIPQTQDWTTLYTLFEQLNSLLFFLLETDEKEIPHYLFFVKDDPQLVALIQSLADRLALVQSIEVFEFGSKKVTKHANDMIQQVLQELGTAIFTEQMVQKLKALEEKYAPEAAKKRKIEEERTKKAEQDVKKSTFGRVTEAGETVQYEPYDFGDFDSYNDYSDRERFYAPGREGAGWAPSREREQQERGKEQESGVKGTGKKGDQRVAEKDEKKKKDELDSLGKMGKKELKKYKKDTEESAKKIVSAVKKLSELITSSEFSDIFNYITNADQDYSEELSIQSAQAAKLIRQIIDDLRAFKLRIQKLPKTDQEKAQKDLLRDTEKSFKPIYSVMRVLESIDYEQIKEDISVQKRFVHFKDDSVRSKLPKDKVATLEKQRNVSFSELGELLKNLHGELGIIAPVVDELVDLVKTLSELVTGVQRDDIASYLTNVEKGYSQKLSTQITEIVSMVYAIIERYEKFNHLIKKLPESDQKTVRQNLSREVKKLLVPISTLVSELESIDYEQSKKNISLQKRFVHFKDDSVRSQLQQPEVATLEAERSVSLAELAQLLQQLQQQFEVSDQEQQVPNIPQEIIQSEYESNPER